ncbi:hypothetical protein D3Z50_03540 [Clostridiaceae bacterium]|jgi:hypothetical protein|nr:hypothetical protein [Clostridiaceae bacterium]
MDYFCIRQDQRYRYTPVIQNFYSTFMRKDFMEDNGVRIPDKNVVFSNSAKEHDRVDILDSQMFAVSRPVKDVFRIYIPSMKFKQFCILNNELNSHALYYAPILKSIPCLKSCDKDALVLYKGKIGREPVFRIQDIQADRVIIRLDVAESLLRRNIKKYNLLKVELEG